MLWMLQGENVMGEDALDATGEDVADSTSKDATSETTAENAAS